MAETSYASCGDLSLAYQVFGDGPVELVFVGPMVTHVELFWAVPEFKAFFEQLATFCRVLLFDKAGVGLSDPIPKVRLLEERAAEIEAVMDAVGFAKAARRRYERGRPGRHHVRGKTTERTRALILYGTFAAMRPSQWDDLDRDPAELRARSFPSWVTTTRRRRADRPHPGNGPRRALGVGQRRTAKSWVPSVRSIRQLAMWSA